MNRAGAALLALLILAGCADEPSGKQRQTDAVLYTIGLSTDPYGESAPQGFGIATGVKDGRLAKVEVREPGLGGFGGAEWLDLSTVVVPRPAPLRRRPLIYRYDGVLKRQGDAPIPGGANYDWSPVAKTAGLPIWSPDQRYSAAVASCCGVVIAHANGEIVQTIRTKLNVSMIAWAPVGRQLAFTTSGFPDPHQLFILDRPSARPRLLYVAPGWHFDWITWSPDGRRILLDDEEWILLDDEKLGRWTSGRWLLLWTDRSGRRRTLPRLGGRPLWCCPVNSYSAGGTARNS